MTAGRPPFERTWGIRPSVVAGPANGDRVGSCHDPSCRRWSDWIVCLCGLRGVTCAFSGLGLDELGSAATVTFANAFLARFHN